MRVLVMGGTHHVGRSLVEVALRRGDTVTTLNRGLSRPPAPGVEALVADRTAPDTVWRALGERSWDAVIDTWAWAPNAVRDSARLLADRARHYGYVSSRGGYAWPWPAGADESAPLVAGDPGSQDGSDYAAAKRGGELAVLEAFGERALLARAGMILGPYEDVGRIPGGCGGSNAAVPCSPPDRPARPCSTSTPSTWRPGCWRRQNVASAGRSTSPGRPGTPRSATCSPRPRR
ncbi:hypothetical protein AB0C27_27740 [Nonomuraea sp. NPDC048882]|uniref:hypothetical protein n=1 Tax=unclassified Nonomuraea TaxID=2593643 RepID=UPI0033F2C710